MEFCNKIIKCYFCYFKNTRPISCHESYIMPVNYCESLFDIHPLHSNWRDQSMQQLGWSMFWGEVRKLDFVVQQSIKTTINFDRKSLDLQRQVSSSSSSASVYPGTSNFAIEICGFVVRVFQFGHVPSILVHRKYGKGRGGGFVQNVDASTIFQVSLDINAFQFDMRYGFLVWHHLKLSTWLLQLIQGCIDSQSRRPLDSQPVMCIIRPIQGAIIRRYHLHCHYHITVHNTNTLKKLRLLFSSKQNILNEESMRNIFTKMSYSSSVGRAFVRIWIVFFKF